MKKYFRKRNENIRKILSKPKDKINIKDIHKLRVNIKKIKAVLNLLCYCDKKFDHKKHYKIYGSLFKRAGKIREYQIEEGLIENYRIPHKDEYLSIIKGKQEKARKKFNSLLEKDLINHICHCEAKISPHISSVKKKHLATYLKSKREKLGNAIPSEKLNEGLLHKFRINLKDYFYILQLLKLTERKKDTHYKDINDLQELLGRWHDLKTTIDELSKTIKEHSFAKTEFIRLKKIGKDMEKQKEEILLKIGDALKKIRLQPADLQ
jgi:CHAD domain-containing protein